MLLTQWLASLARRLCVRAISSLSELGVQGKKLGSTCRHFVLFYLLQLDLPVFLSLQVSLLVLAMYESLTICHSIWQRYREPIFPFFYSLLLYHKSRSWSNVCLYFWVLHRRCRGEPEMLVPCISTWLWQRVQSISFLMLFFQLWHLSKVCKISWHPNSKLYLLGWRTSNICTGWWCHPLLVATWGRSPFIPEFHLLIRVPKLHQSQPLSHHRFPPTHQFHNIVPPITLK